MKTSMRKFARLLLPALSLLAAACSPAEKEKTITIIAVNDIHGGIDNFPSLATLVGEYRTARPGRVLLIDAGDRWTGNPYVDLHPDRGYPMVELMNTLGFDLSTYGNHEFDFGLDILAERVRQSAFPYTAANIDSNGSALPQPDPYRCFDVDGVRICFMGLITTARAGYPDGFVHNFGSIRFSHPVSTALGYRHLKDSCNVLIGLTHIGYELDSVLALQMPELDVIIGGHSHSELPGGKLIDRTLVTQAGSRLHYADIITLTLQGGKLVKKESALVRLDTIAPDPVYTAMIDRYKQIPELSAVQGTLADDFDKWGVMNMVNDMIRQRTGADFSVYNWGGIRVESLSKGPVTLADIYSIEPFGNSVNIVKMTTGQIKELILNKFNSTGKESHRADLYPSGFTYHVRTNLRGDGVDVLFDAGRPLSDDKLYNVAMSDYVATAYNFSAAGTGQSTGIMLTEMLIDHLRKNSPLHGDNTPRVTIGH